MPSSVTLLGPQRKQPNIASTLERLGLDGELATITAGWQERESEDDELSAHVGGRSHNLHLYARAQAIFRDDPELSKAIHERQARLRDLQQLYRLRLEHGMEAVRALIERGTKGRRGARNAELIRAVTEEAFTATRILDAQHLERIREIHEVFEVAWRPAEREAVMREREAIARILRDVVAVAIAGGHVAILRNRLRMFDLRPLIAGKPLLAWSAGAMVAGERIVLFHDSPPQGPGYAEVVEHGLGLYPGLVPFPHARARLELDDPTRVSLLSRRFYPARCMTLESGDRVDWTKQGGYRVSGGDPLRLEVDGSLTSSATSPRWEEP